MSDSITNKFDVIIIGGGASGLFCANTIKSRNPDISVAILEKQKSVGKKLLATGNGRCNITNLYTTENVYHGTFKPKVKTVLSNLSPDDLMKEFKNIGLLTTVDTEGRVYPLSKHSSTVLETLLLACKQNDVQIIRETYITSISNTNGLFRIISNNGKYSCGKLIIATGSKATPETGADDSILQTLKKLGHTITELTPALCPIPVKSKSLHALKGVRVNGVVSIKNKSSAKNLKLEQGEIQFTEKNLSGICIFNLSRIANTLDNTYIDIDLLPDMTYSDVLNMLRCQKQRLKISSIAEDLLTGMFQRKLVNALLLAAGITKDRTVENVTDKELMSLATLIKNWRFDVIKSNDFTRAQVVAGGIDGNEINETNMESNIIKNMYLIGEVVDCDGDCGGYNLHFAFASAYTAAKGITK